MREPPPLLRSMLFVPGDGERKLARARQSDADALILDLEDSVAPSRKAHARRLVAEQLRADRRRAALWVRIHPVAGGEWTDDLDAVLDARPDGLVLPKPRSPDDVARLSERLDELEPRLGIGRGSTRILPIVTETASSVLSAGGYARSSPRLAALTWGAEDLSVALGAETAVDERGEWLPPYQLARSLCLLAASAAGVAAIDTVHANFRDGAGFRAQARAAKRDGFAGALLIHPDQVAIANEVFGPGADEIERARRIVAAFAASPGTGVVSLDGRMLDRPHLERARRVLALAGRITPKEKERCRSSAKSTT